MDFRVLIIQPDRFSQEFLLKQSWPLSTLLVDAIGEYRYRLHTRC